MTRRNKSAKVEGTYSVNLRVFGLCKVKHSLIEEHILVKIRKPTGTLNQKFVYLSLKLFEVGALVPPNVSGFKIACVPTKFRILVVLAEQQPPNLVTRPPVSFER